MTQKYRDDWNVLENGGAPLWDGITQIFVREAFQEEQARWEASRARAILAGKMDEDEEERLVHLLYFVPVTDPTDEEFE